METRDGVKPTGETVSATVLYGSTRIRMVGDLACVVE